MGHLRPSGICCRVMINLSVLVSGFVGDLVGDLLLDDPDFDCPNDTEARASRASELILAGEAALERTGGMMSASCKDRNDA